MIAKISNEMVVTKGYKVVIDYDDLDYNPIQDETTFKIAMFHNGYRLFNNTDYDSDDYESWSEMLAAIKDNENIAFIQPIHMLDHSQLYFSTSDFNNRWDSGIVGFIWITKENFKREYKREYTKNENIQLFKQFESILNIYEKYSNGNVYWYGIYKDGKIIDSCGGFYWDSIEEMKKELKETADISKEDETEVFTLIDQLEW